MDSTSNTEGDCKAQDHASLAEVLKPAGQMRSMSLREPEHAFTLYQLEMAGVRTLKTT